MSRHRQDVTAAVMAWAEARLYVAAAFVVADAVGDRVGPRPVWPLDDGLSAWDGAWYRLIAEVGYQGAEDPAMRFFPLWPLLGRWLGTLIGGPDIALAVLANLLALGCGVLIYRLTLDETGDRAVAARAVRLFSLFPPAFVLVLAYSEALYLVLAMGMVVASRSGRWWTAAALGFLAGLTRPVAAFLGLCALVSARRAGALGRPRVWAAMVAGAAGTATFLVWTAAAHGDPWAPIDRQRELRGDFAEPVTRLLRAFADGVAGDKGEAFHLLTVLMIFALTAVCVRRLSADLWVYAVTSTLLLVSVDNLNSIERYALAVFPLSMAAAIVSRHPLLDRRLPTASAVAMVAVAVLALSGVYVP